MSKPIGGNILTDKKIALVGGGKITKMVRYHQSCTVEQGLDNITSSPEDTSILNTAEDSGSGEDSHDLKAFNYFCKRSLSQISGRF